MTTPRRRGARSTPPAPVLALAFVAVAFFALPLVGLLAYPFAISHLGNDGLPCIDPLPMWSALLADLSRATPVPVIAARFHKGLAIVIADLLKTLSRQTHRDQAIDTVALSGGVFQNRALVAHVLRELASAGFTVFIPERLPVNDAAIAFGQVIEAQARPRFARPHDALSAREP